MRYVNLMGEGKPHLLIKTINNLGAETRVQYAPSTKFYLQDKRVGTPWITKLHFPVHVVERVETYDHIGKNRFITRYSYHHGYFDGEEREFRGFGRVDQLDTEEFAVLSQTGELPIGENVDQASHVPPVLTKTWFHTGAYFERQRLEALMAREYYQGDAQAALLADTILPDQLAADEARQACRALKGSMLRQEVYARDRTGKADHPYSIVEQNMTLVRLQPAEDNRHAVFSSMLAKHSPITMSATQPTHVSNTLSPWRSTTMATCSSKPRLATDAEPLRCRSSGIGTGRQRHC